MGQFAPVKLELQSYILKATAGNMPNCIPSYVVSHATIFRQQFDQFWNQVQGYLAGEDCPMMRSFRQVARPP